MLKTILIIIFSLLIFASTQAQPDTVYQSQYKGSEIDAAIKKARDSVYVKTQIDSALSLKANAADVYTQSELDSVLNTKTEADDITDALVGLATEEYVNNELIDKIDKNYSAYPGIPHPDTDALIPIFQNDTSGTTTVDKLPVSDATQTALNGKQDALVSGTNIKTINSESLLGSGNITIEGTVDTSGDIASKAYVENAINAIPEDSIGITGAEFNTWIDNFRGGTTNQIWKKDSNSDFDGSWIDNTGGSGLTQEQETQLEVTWAYLQLDTTGSFLESFTAQTDVELETLTESDIIEVDVDDTYGITRVAVDSGQYAVLYDLRGTPTWSDWTSAEAWYKGVDSAKVRHYSSDLYETATTQELFIANDSEIFSVTTILDPMFSPGQLNPILVLAHNQDTMTTYNAFDETRVYSFDHNGFTFTETDTSNNAPILTDSSMHFKGNSRFGLSTDTSSIFNMKYNDWTIEYWAWFSGGSASEIVNKASVGLGYAAGAASAGGIFPRFELYGGGSGDLVVTTYNNGGTNLWDNGWYHIAITIDRDGMASIYEDSVLIVQEDFSSLQEVDIKNTANMIIGTSTQEFGHISVFRMYNYALTPAQVKSLYEYGKE